MAIRIKPKDWTELSLGTIQDEISVQGARADFSPFAVAHEHGDFQGLAPSELRTIPVASLLEHDVFSEAQAEQIRHLANRALANQKQAYAAMESDTVEIAATVLPVLQIPQLVANLVVDACKYVLSRFFSHR